MSKKFWLFGDYVLLYKKKTKNPHIWIYERFKEAFE